MSGINQYGNRKHKQACIDLEKATQSITQALQHEVGRNQELCVLIGRLEEREAATERSLTEQVESNSQLQLKITELQKQLEEKDNSLIQANQTVALLKNELRDVHQQLQTQHSQNCVVQEPDGGLLCEDSQLKSESLQDAPISGIKQEDDGEYGHYIQSDGTDLRTDQTSSSAADIKAEQIQEVDGKSGLCPVLIFEPERLLTDAVSQVQLNGLSLGIVDSCSFGTDGTHSGDGPLEYRSDSPSSTSPSHAQPQQNSSSGAQVMWHDSLSSPSGTTETVDQPRNCVGGLSSTPVSTVQQHPGERRYSQSLNPGEGSYSQSLHTGQRPYSQSLNPGQRSYSQILPPGEGFYPRHRPQLSRNFRHKNSSVSVNHQQQQQQQHQHQHQQQQQQLPPTTSPTATTTSTSSAPQKKPSLDCSYCGRAFFAVSKLIIHQRVHTGERPFVCTLCGRTFNQKFNLAVHQRVHTGERPYPCAQCGKSFSRKPDLRMHVRRIHTGEKPFACHLCGRSFSNRTNLKTHLQTHLPKHR